MQQTNDKNFITEKGSIAKKESCISDSPVDPFSVVKTKLKPRCRYCKKDVDIIKSIYCTLCWNRLVKGDIKSVLLI